MQCSRETEAQGALDASAPQARVYSLKEFTEALGAEQVEVFAILLRLGTQEWQDKARRKRLRELLATYRTQPPCEAHLPPVLP